MKFACPMCEATGDIAEEELAHPVTRTACRNCGTILLINPETGKVDAHKSPLKDSPALEASGSQSSEETGAVLSMRPQGRADKDWTAVLVVAVILIALISAGLYFALNLDSI